MATYGDIAELAGRPRAARAVGNIMGHAVGRSMFIEGALARLMYRSLYKMHEAALYGRGRTLLSILSGRTRPTPTVKLH